MGPRDAGAQVAPKSSAVDSVPPVSGRDPLCTASALLAQASARPEGDPVRVALVQAARLVLEAAAAPAPVVPLRRVGP